jgi:hypothetical protein
MYSNKLIQKFQETKLCIVVREPERYNSGPIVQSVK